MQSEPEDAAPDRDRLHHHGTLSPDGTPSFDPAWGAPAGDAGEIAGFAGIYPAAAFSPALDAIVPVPAAHASAAAAGSAATGPATATAADPASGLVIVADYDSSITDLSAPLYAEVTGAIAAAIDFYEAVITNPITITLDFGYGEINGQTLASNALGESESMGELVSYATLQAALEAHDTAAGASPLPASDPLPGRRTEYYVPDAEAQALGLGGAGAPDGYIGLSSTEPFTYNPDDRAVSGEYDLIGVLEHEISEDMGRVAFYRNTNGFYSALDLFRYTAPGALATTGTAGYFSIDGGDTNLDWFNNYTANGGDAGDWSSSGTTDVVNDSYDAFSNAGVANTVSPTDLTVMQMLGYDLSCFAAGTRIRTARGEVPVEDLAVGELVRARFAGLAPIKWIGHRRIDCRRHPDPRQVRPVWIAAGAFAPGRPCRDLALSPDHAVAVGDALIPIRLLVNGASIRQDTAAAAVLYYHIELDRHDLLIADGLAAESYLDTGNRGMFAGADAPRVLHPRPEGPAAQHRREAGSCLALRSDPAAVEPVWRALAARAERLGFTLPAVATTHDPALCIVAGARRFAPIRCDGGRYTFALPALPDGARLRSRCAVPAALRPWLEDRRRLGVMVRRIALRRGAALVEVAPDDPRLADGWWDAERDAASPWRWTDGDAALPPTDDFTVLEVLIGATPPYPLAAPGGASPGAAAHPAARAAA